jgi:ABC-type phosphate/phosphonate transport system substrate-binding protein
MSMCPPSIATEVKAMRRGIVIPATVLFGAVLLTVATGANTAPMTLHVGLVDTLFPDQTEKEIKATAGPFKSLMEEQAKVLGEVGVGGNYERVASELKDKKIDLGVFHGFEFAWARKANPDLKPLMIGINERPYVQIVVVVNTEEKLADPTGLKGKAIALPKLGRETGRLFVERKIVADAMPLDKWFGKVTRPRTNEDALNDVADNVVQVTAVDSVDLEKFKKRYPKTGARLKVLKESEKMPCVVVAYQPGNVDMETLNKVRSGMIGAKSTQRGRDLMELCRLTAFEAVPGDLDKQLAETLKNYPPPK